MSKRSESMKKRTLAQLKAIIDAKGLSSTAAQYELDRRAGKVDG